MSPCSDLDISKPETLSVLGTDNEEFFCESVTPSPSSIALDGRNAGRLCAKPLSKRMRGRSAEPLVNLAFPRIVTRQSTDKTLMPDAYLAKALDIVRRDLSVVRAIDDKAKELRISKRSLEMKENLVLGSTLKNGDNPHTAKRGGAACLEHVPAAVRNRREGKIHSKLRILGIYSPFSGTLYHTEPLYAAENATKAARLGATR